MTTPFDGALPWIWNLGNCDGGDPAAIVARLLSVGASGAIVKGYDAGHDFGDRKALLALRQAFKAAGLAFLCWGYDYDLNITAEYTEAIAIVRALDPDALVADVEAEFEARKTAAQDAVTFVTAVRAAFPDLPIAYAPLPIVRYHVALPYYQFTVQEQCPMLPQLYWTGIGWTMQQTVDTFYADVAQYGLDTQPIYPAYEDAPDYQPNDSDVAVFCRQVKAKGATGVSVWSYEHLDAGGWRRFGLAAQVFPKVAPVPPPVDPRDAQIAALSAQNLELTDQLTAAYKRITDGITALQG